jgi:CubicO group peptidase (beta-lactamase class C family)
MILGEQIGEVGVMDNLAEVLARLDRFIPRKMAAAQTPGQALALTGADRLLAVRAYGYANLAAHTPVTPETLFEIGSQGKTFTAIAVLQQVEAGRIDLDAPVTRYLPWFSVQSVYGPMTVHHLLSHTAGIIAGTEFATAGPAEVWALRETWTGFAPGAHFHYSDVGYKILGLVLERVLGRPYGDIIAEHILAPLGMSDTVPVLTHALRPRLAAGYAPLYDDRPMQRTHPLVPAAWVETDTADGSLASTVGDMAAFLRMLIRRGAAPQGRILSPASFDLLTRPVIEMADGLFYGYGIISSRTAGFLRLQHGGDMPGYESSWRIDAENGLGVAVLMNGPVSAGVADFALKLLRAAYAGQDWPPDPPLPDPLQVADAAEYAGVYRLGDRTLTLRAEDESLTLEQDGTRVPLAQQDDDWFYADHPDWDRFPLTFAREGDTAVAAIWGGDYYRRAGHPAPPVPAPPAAWAAYPGHYRSHNPWRSNFRVVLRQGALRLIEPSGDEEPLTELADGLFRVGEAGYSPERLRFDAIIEAQALRANYSGCDYYRFFTP